MNKILLIIQREYLSRVRKKSFLLTTILVPLIIVGFYTAIIAIAVSDDQPQEKVAIVDDANIFTAATAAEKGKDSSVTFQLIENETVESFKKKYYEQGYIALVYIPAIDIKDPKGIEMYSRASVSMGTKNRVENKIDKAIEQKRLSDANIDPSKYESIKADVQVTSKIDSGKGEKKGAETAAYIVAFAAGLLIYMVLLIYGSMVMRGVMEEKTNRISEVIVSSVKPFQLMFGKIIGIGAVGLTQFFIWMILITVLKMLLPSIGGGMATMAGADAETMQQTNMMATLSENLQSIPIGLLAVCFVYYFIGGYLMYASMFAAIGSVSEDQQDAQQLIFPVMMPIILGFVIMVKAAKEPHSGLAVFGSMFPLTSPIVMIGRIPFDVPGWQIIVSMLLLALFFIFCTWLAGRIYRTGILMYGKKGSWKEMMKWAFKRY